MCKSFVLRKNPSRVAGLVEIVKNGGVVPLVSLLLDEDVTVREQSLLIFSKLLFAPGHAGPENITYFFQAEGERPLLSKSCILAGEEAIQILALNIVLHLVKVSPSPFSTHFSLFRKVNILNIFWMLDSKIKLKKRNLLQT